MTTLFNDIKFGLRQLTKSPGFTLVVVAMLALGIGTNTGLFTVMEQLFLQSLPIHQPETLVSLQPQGVMVGSQWGGQTMSYPIFKDLRDNKSLFDGIFCWLSETVAIQDDQGTQQAEIELVSGNYFEVLGVPPALGRVLTSLDETAPGADPQVVLAYDTWKNQFGCDPEVLGRTLLINRVPMEVVGVAAAGFRGVNLDTRPRAFVPVTMKTQITPWWTRMEHRRTQWIRVMARLPEGQTLTQTEQALQGPYQALLRQEAEGPGFPSISDQKRQRFIEGQLHLSPAGNGHSFLRSPMGDPMIILLGCAILVLLVTCANIANLLMARAGQRQKEMTLRLALGASRWRLLKQLLLENLLLALLGGAAALVVAGLTTHTFAVFLPTPLKAVMVSHVNNSVLVFNLIISLLTGLCFGLLPAWRTTRVDLVTHLKEQAATVVGGGKGRLRQIMVVTQICLSLILLICSGLLIRSLQELYRIETGIQTSNLISFRVDPTQGGYDEPQKHRYCQQLQTRLNALPEVNSTAMARIPLLEGNAWTNRLSIEGYQFKPGEKSVTYCNAISQDYCKTMGIPLRMGREFNLLDEAPDAPPVALVNEAFVRHYLPDRNPIGCRIGMGQANKTIVGVICDNHTKTLKEPVQPMTLHPYSRMGIDGLTVYVRTTQSPQRIFETIRREGHDLNASIPLYDMKTMDDQLDRSLANERMMGLLASVFGILATILAILGLYSVTAYGVSRRGREIGIRIALGAQHQNIIKMMLREGFILTTLGIGLGLAGALAGARILRGLLYGINPNDPVTFTVTGLLLAGVALLTCYLPARRAARIDPMEALRYE